MEKLHTFDYLYSDKEFYLSLPEIKFKKDNSMYVQEELTTDLEE